MSEANTQLPWFKVKFEDGREIEIHSPDAISIYKQDFEKTILQLSQRHAAESKGSVTESQVHMGRQAEYPTIRTAKSTSENLKALFKTDWARAGRTVTELTDALNVNAVPDKPNNISTYLARLVKAGVLRRLEEDGIYHFYPLPNTT